MRVAKKLKEENGVAAVMVTGALMALLLSVAVVTDIGLLYQERRQLQTSTDAAALAIAMDIAEGVGVPEATSRAIEYVSVNANVAPVQIDIGFLADNQVRVAAKTERRLFFSGLIGMEVAQVTAKSTAAAGAASGVANLVPFIVPLQKVADYSGESNAGTFEVGEDRPLDPFSKAYRVEGDTIHYTITYNNTTNKIEDATIRDPIPSGTVYVDGSATSGGVYDSNTNEVTWFFAGVVPDDYRMFTFSVRVVSGSPTSIENTAYLTTSGSGKTTTAKTGTNAQKGYFWLCDFDDGSGGVPDYDNWIRKGYQDYVYTGDVANGTGMKASLKEALTWRMGSDSSIIVPVYSYTEGGGSSGKYHIVGFTEFVITDFNFNGRPKTISGYFTDGTVVKGAPGIPPESYFGIDTVWLVE